MKKTMMKLLSVVMALMMLFGSFSTLVSANVHHHDKTTKLETFEPRCNAYGYTTYICSCGETWATDIVAKTDKGLHSLDVDGTYITIDAAEATCTTDGYKAGKACTWCKQPIEGCEVTAEKTGHDFQWVVDPADCNNIEKLVYKCVNKNCNELGARPGSWNWIDLDSTTCADGHDYVYNVIKYPTCEMVPAEDGSVFKVDAEGNRVLKYSVKTTNGLAEYECTDCGLKHTNIVIKFSNHDKANLVPKNNGYLDDCEHHRVEWMECLVCGYASEYKYYDKYTDHIYKLATVDQAREAGYKSNTEAPDCYFDGYNIMICEHPVYAGADPLVVDGKTVLCNSIYKEVIPAEHTKLYTCPVCADCQDCTHKDRVLKCGNTPSCDTVGVKAQYEKHEWSEQLYYAYDYIDEMGQPAQLVGKYNAEFNYCRAISIFRKCEHENCAQTIVVDTKKPVAGAVDHIDDYFVYDTKFFEKATCTTDGYIFVNCHACLDAHRKLVGDEANKFVKEHNITTLAGVEFKALGHIYPSQRTGVIEVATCDSYTYTGDLVCERAGCIIEKGVEGTKYNLDYHGQLVDPTAGDFDAEHTANGGLVTTTGEVITFIIDDKGNVVYSVDGVENKALKYDIQTIKFTDGTKTYEPKLDSTLIGMTIPATCNTPFTRYFKCNKCSQPWYDAAAAEMFHRNEFNHKYYVVDKANFTYTTVIENEADVLVVHEAKDAVCEVSDGNIKYKSCKYCLEVTAVWDADLNKYIEERDVNGNGIKNVAEPFEDLDNDGVHDDKEPYDDLDKDREYDPTDIFFTKDDVIISKAHAFIDIKEVKETCFNDGTCAYQLPCTRCGAKSPYTQKIIPAHGDKYWTVIDPETAAKYPQTCSTTGVDAGRYCAECDTRADWNDTTNDGKAIPSATKNKNGEYKLLWDYNPKPNLDATTNKDPWNYQYDANWSFVYDGKSVYKELKKLGHSGDHMKTIAAKDLVNVTAEKGDCRTETFGVTYCDFCIREYDRHTDTYAYEFIFGVDDIRLLAKSIAGRKIPDGAWTLTSFVIGRDHKFPAPVYREDAEASDTDLIDMHDVNVTINFPVDKDGKFSDPNGIFDECTTDKKWEVTCEVCLAETKVVKEEKATGHYYFDNTNKKNIIDLSCTKIDSFKDWRCAECDLIVGRSLTAKHNIIQVVIPAKCEMPAHLALSLAPTDPVAREAFMNERMSYYGQTFWACADCDARYFKDNTDPFAEPNNYVDFDHDYESEYVVWDRLEVGEDNHEYLGFLVDEDGKPAGFKAPTYTEAGYYTKLCAKCGNVQRTIPKLAPSIDLNVYAVDVDPTVTDKNGNVVSVDVDKAVASGDEFDIIITYTADNNAYTFHALQIDLEYDAELISFLKDETNKKLPAGVAAEISVDAKGNPTGNLSIAIYTLDGVILNANETREVRVSFRAKSDFSKSEIVSIVKGSAFDKNGAVIDPNFVANIPTFDLGHSEYLISQVTGELNGYLGIDAGDAIVMMDYIYANKFISKADMNKDKKVDMADFAILNKLIATNGSNEAYKQCINANVTAVNGVYYTKIS